MFCKTKTWWWYHQSEIPNQKFPEISVRNSMSFQFQYSKAYVLHIVQSGAVITRSNIMQHFILCSTAVAEAKYKSEFKLTIDTHRADSRFAPSQLETSLQSNAVSHWLDANLEWALPHISPSWVSYGVYIVRFGRNKLHYNGTTLYIYILAFYWFTVPLASSSLTCWIAWGKACMYKYLHLILPSDMIWQIVDNQH